MVSFVAKKIIEWNGLSVYFFFRYQIQQQEKVIAKTNVQESSLSEFYFRS